MSTNAPLDQSLLIVFIIMYFADVLLRQKKYLGKGESVSGGHQIHDGLHILCTAVAVVVSSENHWGSYCYMKGCITVWCMNLFPTKQVGHSMGKDLCFVSVG